MRTDKNYNNDYSIVIGNGNDNLRPNQKYNSIQ